MPDFPAVVDNAVVYVKSMKLRFRYVPSYKCRDSSDAEKSLECVERDLLRQHPYLNLQSGTLSV